MPKHPNILLIAIDSLRRDRMSLYGFDRLTTPHIDRFARQGTIFNNTISAHIPTTPAYASMLTGRDTFGTQVVALRHKGQMRDEAPTLAEILRERAGYHSVCVGFTGNPASRGFDEYINYTSWGGWEDRPLRKAENLNDVAQPAIDRMADQDKPWFMMLRHMDPHSPYLPPAPYDRMFYQGNETDPSNHSLDALKEFKPFADYVFSWLPEGCTDAQYVNAQYDGAVAYMDACIQNIFTQLEARGLLENTIVVINGDHGETLDEHDCWYDHHGLYDNCLVVPLVIRYPGKIPAGKRVDGFNQHKDLAPTLLELAEVDSKGLTFDGQSLMSLVKGEQASFDEEIYITECTWMRKHGWRTPRYKLIVAKEPDCHFKPEVELYDLVKDPEELRNIAEEEPAIVADLRQRMEAFIENRQKDTGLPNPIDTNLDWHGKGGGPFKTSQQAFDTLYIGNAAEARKLQEKAAKQAKAETAKA